MVREAILQKLRQGHYVSGQRLGETLNISRSAVWKYVNELRREGYGIESSPNKGYRLTSAPDVPFADEIRSGLHTDRLGNQIVFLRETTSTQEAARALAVQMAPEGTVVIAETQTAGRGRVGRGFASPPGGIYFSVILRPQMTPTEALLFPLLAGIAVARAISSLTTLEPRLKWPNDIIINEKKVGGILTEMSAEIDRLDFIIIGIGVNVNTTRDLFPDDVREIASSLLIEQGSHVSRVNLVRSILMELEVLYDAFQESGFEPLRNQWIMLSNTIGRWITASSGNRSIEGKAIDLNADGSLTLQKRDGTLERIIAGDIFVTKTPSEMSEK